MRTLLAALLLLLPSLAFAGPGTLAVMYFENQGNPELESLKVGLSQMLITDLQGEVPGLTVVERTRLQEILDELDLGHQGKVEPGTAARVGKLLGAEWMLMGSYFELMGTMRIDVRLVDVETGKILHAHGVNDASSAFMHMEKSLAEDLEAALAQQLGTQPTGKLPTETQGTATARTEPTRTQRSVPTEVTAPDAKVLEAAVAYSDGLMALDRKDVGRAREAFEAAVSANPDLELAKEELAALEI